MKSKLTGPYLDEPNSDSGEVPRRRLPVVGQLVSERYEIKRRIGEGGMGVVFEAFDEAEHRRVALKFPHPDLRAQPELLQRFHREADVLSQLDHPAIVTVMGKRRAADGTPFLVTELLEGINLRQYLEERGPLNVQLAVEMLLPVCDGISVANRNGFVHRDVKPGNLFVELEAGVPLRVKLLDFGLARVSEVTPLTREGTVLGTLGYMAPECARGELDIDGRADVFSLGTVLYECVCGRRAFPGSSMQEVGAQLRAPVPPQLPGERGVKLPMLQAILDRALARERDDRYSDVHELVCALRQLPEDELRLTYDVKAETAALVATALDSEGAFETRTSANANASLETAPTDLTEPTAGAQDYTAMTAVYGAMFRGPVCTIIWRGETDQATIEAIKQAVLSHMKHNARAVLLTIFEPGTKAPPARVREAAAAANDQLIEAGLLQIIGVVPVAGFFGALVRGVLTNLFRLSSNAPPVRLFASTRDACDWAAAILPATFDPIATSEAIEAFRVEFMRTRDDR